MSTCNRLDLESQGSWPTLPENFPGTASNTTQERSAYKVLPDITHLAEKYNVVTNANALMLNKLYILK